MPVRFYGGPLNALSEGFAAGSQGFAAGMRHKQVLKQRQDEEAENTRRYEEEKKLAVEAANRQVANDVFAKNIQGRQQDRLEADQARANQREDQLAEGSQALAQFGVTGNRMGPPDPEEQFAMDVARRMTTPAMAERFVKEYEGQKRQEMLTANRERMLSELDDMKKEPLAFNIGGDEWINRIEETKQALGSVQDPEGLSQVLKDGATRINDMRNDMAVRQARMDEVNDVGNYYRQQLATDMQNAMLERNPAIKAWKLQQIDQQRRYLGAFLTSKPGSVKTADFLTKMSQLDNDFPASMLNQGGAGAKGQGNLTEKDAMDLAAKALGQDPLNPPTPQALRAYAKQLREEESGFGPGGGQGGDMNVEDPTMKAALENPDVEAAATDLYEKLTRQGLPPEQVDAQLREFAKYHNIDPDEPQGQAKSKAPFEPDMSESVLNEKPKSKVEDKRPRSVRFPR